MAKSYIGCSKCGRYRGVLSRKPKGDGFNVQCRDCSNTWESPSTAEGAYKSQQVYKDISRSISKEDYDQAIGVTGTKPYK